MTTTDTAGAPPPIDHVHADGVALCPACTGTWLVSTTSGTTYQLDLDAMTATRVPNPARAQDMWESHQLRRDGDVLPLYGFDQVVVGTRLILAVGELSEAGGYVATQRYTTPVIDVSSA